MPVELSEASSATGADAESGPFHQLSVRKVLPAYQQVSDQIQELIINGTLPVGERLPAEGEMASQFGVSRSTVREALRGLSSQSLVRTKQGVNGGTFVTEPSAEHLQDYLETTIGLLSGTEALSVGEILEARELFEVPAARNAAIRRTDEQLRHLESTLASGAEVELAHDFEGHKEFHFAIIQAAGNRLLEVIARPVFSVLRIRFLRDRASHDFWVRVAEEHELIYDAIAARDAVESSRLMNSHLCGLRAMYKRIDRENQRNQAC